MDQVHEKNEAEDTKELLQEIVRFQELILERLERLESAVAQLKR